MNASTETRDYRRFPLCLPAAGALALAIVALGLAIVGVYNPWLSLRFPLKPVAVGDVVALYGLLFIAPIILGLLAALLGGHAFRIIERSTVPLRGDGFAFFSIMIGLFAAIMGASTTFACLIWPIL